MGKGVGYGSQYTHLISRRLRQFGVAAEIFGSNEDLTHVDNLEGIVLSGGSASVYEKGSPKFNKKLLGLGLPILGICYGLQLSAKNLGGTVTLGRAGEYGKEAGSVKNKNPLFCSRDNLSR